MNVKVIIKKLEHLFHTHAQYTNGHHMRPYEQSFVRFEEDYMFEQHENHYKRTEFHMSTYEMYVTLWVLTQEHSECTFHRGQTITISAFEEKVQQLNHVNMALWLS